MTTTPDPRYRPCVGAMLINGSGLVFVGERLPEPDGPVLSHPWQMPQGGVDPGEDLIAAAKRELHEETGVSSVKLLAEAPGWYAYDIPPELAGPKRRKWRGQTQKWFAFRFLGDEREIDLAGAGHAPEFRAWRWVEMDALPGLVVPFKRPVYEKVVEAFRGLVG
jgi:putative (di)nucleoside polyphosphate hydrolase